MPYFDVDVLPSADGASCRLVVVGEVDCLSAAALASTLVSLLRSDARSVEVDLSGVTFMGCAGLTVLVEARSAATERGIALRVIAASQPAERVIGLGRLKPVLMGPGALTDSGAV